MELSKELLSEVLGYRIKLIKESHTERFIIVNDDGGFCPHPQDTPTRTINIYELAHKCKEWAWENGCIISSFPTKIHWRVVVDSKELFISNSEPEAIFRACQWILDNKEIRYLPGLSDYKYGGTK